MKPPLDNKAYCGEGELAALADPSLTREWNRILGNYEHTKLWGLTTGVGYAQHAYFDADSLSKKTVDKVPWSVGAFFGFEPVIDQPYLLLFTYKHQYDAKDNKQKVACPAGSADTTKCVYGSIGTPAMQTKDLVGVEFRDKINDNWAFKLAPTYDTRNRIWSVDLPIFFIPLKGKLAGGLDLTWKNSPNQSSVGFFLSQPFTTLYSGG